MHGLAHFFNLGIVPSDALHRQRKPVKNNGQVFKMGELVDNIRDQQFERRQLYPDEIPHRATERLQSRNERPDRLRESLDTAHHIAEFCRELLQRDVRELHDRFREFRYRAARCFQQLMKIVFQILKLPAQAICHSLALPLELRQGFSEHGEPLRLVHLLERFRDLRAGLIHDPSEVFSVEPKLD